jgi:hypothetical protein
MARPLRIQFSGGVDHVINRGSARPATFVQEQDYEAFLKTRSSCTMGGRSLCVLFNEQSLSCLS